MEWLSALAAAAVLGFLGSAHCLGMCGPLVAALNLAPETQTKTSSWLPSHLIMKYSLGRIFGYTLIGGLLGIIGLKVESLTQSNKSVVMIFTAIVMLIYGIASLGQSFWPKQTTTVNPDLASEPSAFAKIWNRLKSQFQQALQLIKTHAPRLALGIGVATAFLPCGLLYAAYAQALVSRHPVLGAGVMLTFALASTPAFWLLSILMGSIQRRQSMRLWLQRSAAIFVIILGSYNLYYGLKTPKQECCCHESPAASEPKAVVAGN